MNTAHAQKYLKTFDFGTLFREVLGWNNHKQTVVVVVDDTTYTLSAFAEKGGMVALLCAVLPE